MTVKCPHCRWGLQLRTSRQLTPTFKELRFQCVNLDCSGSYVASLTIDRTIQPSASPNPSIKLPTAPPRHLEPANDVGPEEEASEA